MAVKRKGLYESPNDDVKVRIICEEKGVNRVYDFVLKEIYLEEGSGYRMLYFQGYRLDPITKADIDTNGYTMGFSVSKLYENADLFINDPQIALMELQRIHRRFADRFKIDLFTSERG